ncbi:MAG TPA: methyltransferase domain-containing protein [Candidatus Norongarragalinales archaeon]|nr:methyltransferase domain-containing protein [Candidatus Norongarragalinales archaeon]
MIKDQSPSLSKPHAYAWEKEYRTGRGRWRGTTNFQFEAKKGSRILEVGCGNGKHLSSLLDKGFEVHGVDVSPSAIKLAKERVNLSSEGAKLFVGDATALQFNANFFDVVFLFHILGHLSKKEREMAINEAFRVLKKGGKCYFREFHVSDYRFGRGVEVENNTFRKGTNIWVHYFTEEEVKEGFEKARFHVASIILDSYKHIFHGKEYGRCEMDAVVVK